MSATDIRTHVLLRSEETDGEVSIIENVLPAGMKGPHLHTHDFDEAFYVMEGEITFQVEDQIITRGPGELAFAPRNVAHTLANRSGAPARYLLVCTPAGFERYFARMAARQAGTEPPEWALGPIPAVARVGAQIGEDA